jgi:uncharacterized protein YuzE
MASLDEIIELDYDATNDVLYASLGAPQAALSYELIEDVLFRYIPPSQEVIGITIMNFSEHYPVHDKATMPMAAKPIVQELLRKYPRVPLDEVFTINIAPNSWLLSSSSVAAGTHPDDATKYLSHPALYKSPDIQCSPQPEKDKVS